ncbi:MAG TPA: hypothetical protein PK563_06815, partial [Tenuifilaceae bacterium]|nr:hypothetical protein [Tenuifilaceae bacterium]
LPPRHNKKGLHFCKPFLFLPFVRLRLRLSRFIILGLPTNGWLCLLFSNVTFSIASNVRRLNLLAIERRRYNRRRTFFI